MVTGSGEEIESLFMAMGRDDGENGFKKVLALVFWFSWVVGKIEDMSIDIGLESDVTACLETVACEDGRENENGWMWDLHCLQFYKNSKFYTKNLLIG